MATPTGTRSSDSSKQDFLLESSFDFERRPFPRVYAAAVGSCVASTNPDLIKRDRLMLSHALVVT